MFSCWEDYGKLGQRDKFFLGKYYFRKSFFLTIQCDLALKNENYTRFVKLKNFYEILS